MDDHSRHAQVELRRSETGKDCTAFTQAVITEYAHRGTPIQRILTDNGAGYRSHAFRDLLNQNGIRHIRTKPYTPRTNGKAEAFIRILQREWAYAFIYPTSTHRAKALPGYLRWYNTHRPHGGIGGQPPITRISHAARSYIPSAHPMIARPLATVLGDAQSLTTSRVRVGVDAPARAVRSRGSRSRRRLVARDRFSRWFECGGAA